MELQIKTLKMLKYINRHNPDSQAVKKKFGETAQLRLQELKRAHAINFKFEADGVTHTIYPSTEGLIVLEDYLTREKRDRKIDFRKSVYFPILVTIATNLLLHGIKPLLSLLLTLVSTTL